MTKNGFALIMTLWALVLLTVFAMSFSFTSRSGTASVRNFKEDAMAHYLAVSAYEEALSYILTDKDPSVDFIDADGNFRTDAERKSIAGLRELEGAKVRITMTDEESKANINYQTPASLRAILMQVSVPDGEIDGMIDSLFDWMDPDDLHRLSGAESEYYGEFGYKPKNRPFEVPEELLLVKGFKKEYLYGGGTTSPLYGLVTTRGEGININTVSEELLQSFGFSDPEIKAIIEQRKSGGLRAAPPRLGGAGLTASRNFRIEVRASVGGSPQAIRLTAIVKKTQGQDGPELKSVYWREDVENGGV